MEMEMSDMLNCPFEASADDGMWEGDLDKGEQPSCKKPSQVTLAWQRTL